MGVAVTPNGQYAYVTTDVSNMVYVIKTGAPTVSTVAPTIAPMETSIVIGTGASAAIILTIVVLILQKRLKTKFA